MERLHLLHALGAHHAVALVDVGMVDEGDQPRVLPRLAGGQAEGALRQLDDDSVFDVAGQPFVFLLPRAFAEPAGVETFCLIGISFSQQRDRPQADFPPECPECGDETAPWAFFPNANWKRELCVNCFFSKEENVFTAPNIPRPVDPCESDPRYNMPLKWQVRKADRDERRKAIQEEARRRLQEIQDESDAEVGALESEKDEDDEEPLDDAEDPWYQFERDPEEEEEEEQEQEDVGEEAPPMQWEVVVKKEEGSTPSSKRARKSPPVGRRVKLTKITPSPADRSFAIKKTPVPSKKTAAGAEEKPAPSAGNKPAPASEEEKPAPVTPEEKPAAGQEKPAAGQEKPAAGQEKQAAGQGSGSKPVPSDAQVAAGLDTLQRMLNHMATMGFTPAQIAESMAAQAAQKKT
eukprot:jgi/Mesvir1/7614/Mv16702-RA.1